MLDLGSSPCLRGTRTDPPPPLKVWRIIPVPTGNACDTCEFKVSTADHPRAYGERTILRHAGKRAAGSSPCLRGTLFLCCFICWKERIIPVPTGNAQEFACKCGKCPDHPRAYGERLDHVNPSGNSLGSSPCLRGTPCSAYRSFDR